jgi:hypothetical protein
LTQPLTERYRERLAGVLSCYDRIIVVAAARAWRRIGTGPPMRLRRRLGREWVCGSRRKQPADRRRRGLGDLAASVLLAEWAITRPRQ